MSIHSFYFILLSICLISCEKNISPIANNACELTDLDELMRIMDNYSDRVCATALFEFEPNVTHCTLCWEDDSTGNEYVFDITYFQNLEQISQAINLETYLSRYSNSMKPISSVGDAALIAKLGNRYRYLAFHNSKRVVVIDFSAIDLDENEIMNKLIEIGNLILERI